MFITVGRWSSPSSGLTSSGVRRAAGIPSPCLALLSLGCVVCCWLQPHNLLLQVVLFFTKMRLGILITHCSLQPWYFLEENYLKAWEGMPVAGGFVSPVEGYRNQTLWTSLKMSSSCGKAVISRWEGKKPGMSLHQCWACTTLNMSHVLSLTCVKSIKISHFCSWMKLQESKHCEKMRFLQEMWARHKSFSAHLPQCWAARRQSHCSGDAEQRAADASQSQLTVMSKNKWFVEILLVQALLWKALDGWRLFGNGRCQLSWALQVRRDQQKLPSLQVNENFS